MIKQKTSVDFAFIDSGTGGLPYMLHLKKLYPHMTCVYLADTLNFPYGEKTPEQIDTCAAGAVDRVLAHFSPRAVIVACNTISVTSLGYLRSLYSVPFIGTVPAIKLAATGSKNKKIGLLATRATVSHEYTDHLIRDFAADCTVYKRGDNTLVDFIEHHLFTSSKNEKIDAVKPAVDYFLSNGADTIILGCTHFIHLASEIQEYAGPDVHVVDSREGVVRQAVRVWTEEKEKNAAAEAGHTAALLNKKACADCERTTGAGAAAGAGANVPDEALFISGAGNQVSAKQNSTAEYEIIASSLGIPWCGILPAAAQA